MSTIIRPAAPQHPALADSEHYIDEQISRTRRALKLADFAAGVITLAIGLMAFLLVAAVLDHWVVPGGLGGVGRTTLFGVLILAAAWYFWHQFVPLFRPINPVFAAATIERSSPSLKNSLLNLVLFRTHRQAMSARVYHALERQAAERLSTASVDGAVDRSGLLRLGYALAAIVAVCALYAVLSPKELAVSAGRVLAPWADLAAPSRVKILDVLPGETSIALGERLAVSAEIHGLNTDEPVRLRYSTADEQLVGESIPMTPAAVGGRYEGQLPRSAGGQGAVGVQQDLSYWIEAGDARSKPFAVSVFLRPTLVVQRVRYEYPAYTGLPSKEVESTGDLSGIEGTRVSISAISNQPIKRAYVDFDADGRNDVKMSVEGNTAVASFELALRDDRRTPQHDSYVLRLTTTADRTNADPPKYRIDVSPDYPPEVEITAPQEPELEVRVDEIVPIGVEAHDPDFALEGVRLVGRAGDREIEMGQLLSERHEGRFAGKKPFTPGDAQLKPGDVLEYWAEARDVRRPDPHVTASDRRRLRIVGGADDAAGEGRQPRGGAPKEGDQGGGKADGGQQGGEAGGGEAGGEQSDGEGDAAQGPGQEGGDQASDQSPDGKGNESGGEASSDESEGDGGGAGGGENAAQDQAAGEQSKPGDQQQPGDSDGEPGDQGDAASNEAGGAEPGKVSAAGDSDAEAFERIAQHMEQDEAGQDEPKAGEQTEGQRAPHGEGRPDGEEQQGGGQQSADPREEAGDGQQQGSEGEPQPNERPGADAPHEPKLGDGNPGDQQQNGQRAEESAMNRNQGDAGSGADGQQPEGSASDGSAKQARDKQDDDNQQRMDDQTPPGGSNDKQESNSSGGQSGDKSGGGQSGSGQHADAPGKGTAGQNSAADAGAGAADEPGKGETGTSGGADKLADGQTGESSGDESGPGSETGDAEGGPERASPPKPGEQDQGQPSGGKQPGAAGEDAAGQEPSGAGAEGQQPSQGEAQAPDPAQQPGQPGGESPAGAQDGPQSADAPTKPQPQSPPQQGAQGAAGGQPQGGGQGAADGSGGVPDQQAADAANLEYARKQTDLVLERLDEQLAKRQVDKNLLKSLGWNEEELRQFVDRWKGLKEAAETADNDDARRELDAALRSLGMRTGGPGRYSAASKEDRIRDLNEDVRKPAPQEFADQVRRYNKGVAAGADKKD
jgi:hypothetical protein